MKNKVLLLSIALILFVFSANSQNTGISFGLRGGVNFQNINGKDLNGDKLTLSMVPRFNLGVVAEVPVAPDFYFQPGLLFTTKGAKSKDSFLGSLEYNISYIELPLSFLYKPLVGKGHFFLGFGPYLAYGIGGKAKYSNVTEKIVFTKEFNSTDWKYFKHFDYGGNLFFGYELSNGISLQLNTQMGFAKINADNNSLPNNKSEFRNTGFGLSLGYSF